MSMGLIAGVPANRTAAVVPFRRRLPSNVVILAPRSAGVEIPRPPRRSQINRAAPGAPHQCVLSQRVGASQASRGLLSAKVPGPLPGVPPSILSRKRRCGERSQLEGCPREILGPPSVLGLMPPHNSRTLPPRAVESHTHSSPRIRSR